MRLPRVVAIVGAMLAASAVLGQDLGSLAPRAKPRKTPTEQLAVPQGFTGRLVVKFDDAAKARAVDDGDLVFLGSGEPAPIRDIAQAFGLKFVPAIKSSPQVLEAIEARARQHSGRAQPDLGGMMYVYGRRDALLGAARRLNDLGIVEWVVLEQQAYPDGDPNAGNPAAAGNTGACCLADFTCAEDIGAVDCVAIGGVYQGDGTVCANPSCGACCLDADTGNCRDLRDEDVCELSIGGTYLGDQTECDDPDAGCFSGGACCLNDGIFSCNDLTQTDCDAIGGTYQGDGSDCADSLCGGCCIDEETCIEPTTTETCAAAGGSYIGDAVACAGIDCAAIDNCGEAATGDCYDLNGNGSPFCNEEECCTLICEIDEFCCDDVAGEWNAFCAQEANWLCDNGDNCTSFLNGSCFEVHNTGGCNNEDCCGTVCDVEPGCCDGTWDSLCVLQALALCPDVDVGDETPDFEALQGYLTVAGYTNAEIAANPFLPTLAGDPAPGYGGQGWDLRREGESFTDLNDNNWWDPGEPWDDANADGIWDAPGGLWGLAEELLYKYGINNSGVTGNGNLTKGRKGKVAVLEWACWNEHEDLDVIVERNQTLIQIPDITGPDHATACLSIIGAEENGFGVTGIVPDCKLLFFPLTSVEDGPRYLTAFANAITALDDGDVMSCSFGPPPININCVQDTWTMIRLAADSGITVCVAAGNSCADLATVGEDLGDSGGIVVGACSPGAPYYRLTFSNFNRDEAAGDGNTVHVKAWGENVMAAGYGVIYAPPGEDGEPYDFNRSYTPLFNGTSAATPQIAGLAMAYQGLAKQFYGIPLPPTVLRSVLQQGTVGGIPGLPPFGTFPETVPCGFDNSPEGYNSISVYPRISDGTTFVVNQEAAGYTDAPLLKDIVIVKGGRVVGNAFSVKGDDAQYLSIGSVFVNRYNGGSHGGSSQGGQYDVPELGSLTYLASGQSTDVVGIFETEIDNPVGMTIDIQLLDPTFTVLSWVEAYNWMLGRWDFLGVEILPNTDDDPESYLAPEAPSPRRFVRDSDGRLLVRNWNLGLTGFGNASGPVNFFTLMDLFDVRITNEFGEGG